MISCHSASRLRWRLILPVSVLNFFCAGVSLAACLLVLIRNDWEEDVAIGDF